MQINVKPVCNYLSLKLNYIPCLFVSGFILICVRGRFHAAAQD